MNNKFVIKTNNGRYYANCLGEWFTEDKNNPHIIIFDNEDWAKEIAKDIGNCKVIPVIENERFTELGE